MSFSEPSLPPEADAHATEDAANRRAPLARAIPWLVTIVAFGWIFATTDLQQMVDAVRQADWIQFFGAMMVLYSAVWFVDVAAITWIYRRRHVPTIRFADVLPARGVTYILGIINYAAGAAAMALYFKRRYGIGAVEGGASLLLIMLVDLGLLVLAVVAGASMLPEQYQGAVMWLGLAFAAGAIGHLVFWRAPFAFGPVEPLRDRVRQHPSLRGFRDAPVLDYLVLGVLRLPVIGLYIAMHWFTLGAFRGIEVPLERLLVYVPIQMVIAALPISVSGLGTVNAAQRILYGPYATGEGLVDAYGIALVAGFAVPRIIIGLISMPRAARDQAPGAPSERNPT